MANDIDDAVFKAAAELLAILKPLDEDARYDAINFALKRLKMTPLTEDVERGLMADVDASISDAGSSPHPTRTADIRSFAAQKDPKTVNEKVAVVAYYLAHLAPPDERKDKIVSEDVGKYFVQAGFPLPTSTPAMTLTNTKNAGYLNVLDRGQYKLNAVGHNLVAHKLPEAAGASMKKNSRRTRAKRKTRR